MKPVSCIDDKGVGSYGGSQMWYRDRVLVNSGCGVIAGLEILLFMQGIDEVNKNEYLDLMDEAAGFIKPLRLPFKVDKVKIFGKTFMGSFGVTIPRLKRGLRKLSKDRGIDCKVKSYGTNIVERTRELLDRGMPVILLIRAPFNNVTLYNSKGKSISTLGQHYVIVTDYDEEKDLFVVSSWGEKYKIDPTDLRKFSVSARFCYAERINP
ncbi:MAG: C39 family peptidase [Saccharofermentans sp.]|nr:C39 family peptidase [Saccharofermentans sp.]